MAPDVFYEIVEQNIAHEVIDGEVIIIHFDSGNYYSLEGTAAQLWQWFAARASRQQILGAFQDLQPDQIQSFDAFVETLVKEQLLAITAADANHPSATPLPQQEVPFQALKFMRYNDMQDLLLADPIHESDKKGWPNLEGDRR